MDNMNKFTFMLCSALIASGTATLSAQTVTAANGKQAPAVAEVRVTPLADILRNAQNAVRSKDIAKAEAATKILLERNDTNPVQKYNAISDMANLYRASGKNAEAEKTYIAAAALEGIDEKLKQRALDAKNNIYFDLLRNAVRAGKIEDTKKACDAFLALKDITPTQRYNAYVEMRNAYDRAKMPNEAFAELQKGAAVKGLPPKEALRAITMIGEKHFRDNFPNNGNGAYLTEGLNKAIAIYSDALKNPAFGNMEKIELYKRIADCRLEFMDLKGALAELDNALAIKDMTPEETFTAKYNKGNVLFRAMEYRKALDVFADAQKDAKTFKENDRRLKDIASRISACTVELETPSERKARIEKIMAAQDASVTDKAYAIRTSGDLDSAAKLYESTILDKTKSLNDRARALSEIINMYYDAARFEDAKKYAEKYADQFIKEDPKRYGTMYRGTMLGSNLKHRGINKDRDVYRWIIGKHLETNKPDIQIVDALMETEIAAGDFNAAAKVIDLGLSIENLKPEQKLDFEMKKMVVKTAGKVTSISADLDKLISASIEKISGKDKAQKMLDAARFAMSIKFFDVAKNIYDARAKLMLDQPKPEIACTFVEKGPKDITEFMNSKAFKDTAKRGYLNRKFGDNLQFILDTDAALTGRKVTADNGGNEYTSFVTVCDPEGVKFLFYMPCTDQKRLQNIRDGFTGMGGFETYLASGYYSPYYCFLIDCPPWNNLSVFNTQYNNTKHRNMSLKDKNLKIDFEILDDSVACMMTLDWSVFVEELPVNGTVWDFEPIHWERGGLSWGGSESVHNRSSFGKLVFENMTPENRTKIMRRLLVKAKNAWNDANSSWGGLVEHWQDPELGDVEFNAEVVAPFKEKYGAYANMIKAEMTDADVNKVFNEAYPVLINAYYVIQDMRRDWLEAKRVNGK